MMEVDSADIAIVCKQADAPIIKLINQLISEAVRQRASDIHVEPMANRVRIRYRIDGVCIEKEQIPLKLKGSVLARMKLMAGNSRMQSFPRR